MTPPEGAPTDESLVRKTLDGSEGAFAELALRHKHRIFGIYSGYFFGNLEVVKRNFTFVIFAIIFISILPGIIEFIRHRQSKSST